MADLAVGLVSLALQISKGLVWYIDGAKDAKDRRTKILKDTEMLANYLERLDQVIKKTSLQGGKNDASAGIVACAEALQAIEEKMRWKRSTGESRVREQMRNLGQRLAFPFKQDELNFLREILRSMEQHLQIALLALQLEAQERTNRDIARLLQLSEVTYPNGILDRQNTMLARCSTQASTQSLSRLMDQRMDPIHHELNGVAEVLRPMAMDLSTVSATYPAIMSKLVQLEEKLDDTSLRDLSPRSLKGDVSDYTETANEMKQLRRTAFSKTTVKQHCTCRGREITSSHIKWPLKVSTTQAHVHDPGCRYAVFEEAVVTLQIKLTMCNVSLRRKAHVGLALSRGAGSSSISPMLKCERVVPKNSPAFKLLGSFKKRLGHEPELNVWEETAKELLKLFELRKASPHDRLPNGMTLLHYFCYKMFKFFTSDAEFLIPNYHAMAKTILQYLPTQALERDDEGRTCIDYFIVGNHADLVEHFLEHGVSVSIWRHIDTINWGFQKYGIELSPAVEDLLDCSEHMKIILLQDEKALQDLIGPGNTSPDIPKEHASLYEMVTNLGWRRGCEILLDHGVPITIEDKSRRTLLQQAIDSKQEDMARFWLEARQEMDSVGVKMVGNIESAAMEVQRWRDSSQPQWMTMFVSALVQQRRQLQLLAVRHSIDYRPDRLLDAQVFAIIRALEQRGIRVKPFLIPPRRSVYHAATSNWLTPTLDAFYNAGFLDVTSQDFDGDDGCSIPPLLYLLTSVAGPSTPFDLANVTSWFIHRGADINDRWPGSDTTVAQCLAYRLGNRIFSRNFPHARAVENFTSNFADSFSDDCKCPCSTSGCCFVTFFCKGLSRPNETYTRRTNTDANIDTEWRALYRSWRDRLELMETFIENTRYRYADRWLVTEFIRLIVFNELGIRHTCCDLSRITQNSEPDLTLSPVPRYEDEELHSIREDDAELVELLEQLVKKFDEKFDQKWGDLLEFVEWTLLPEMDEVLEKLEEEDRTRYAQSRREGGVRMGSAYLDEDESSDLSTDESDDEDSGED